MTLVGRCRVRAWPTWTDPVRRTLVIIMAGVIAFILLLVMARYALGSGVGYYLKKGLYALLVVDLILLGGLGATAREIASGWSVPFPGARSTGGFGATPLPRWLPPVAGLVAALLVLTGAEVLNPAPARGLRIFLPVPAAGTNYGRAYAAGALALPDHAAAVLRAARTQGDAPGGRLIVFWDAYGRGYDFYNAQWANVLNRRLSADTMATMVQIPKERRSGDELEKLLDSLGEGPGATPVLLLTREDATVARVAAFRASHPGADIIVLRLPGTCGAKCLK